MVEHVWCTQWVPKFKNGLSHSRTVLARPLQRTAENETSLAVRELFSETWGNIIREDIIQAEQLSETGQNASGLQKELAQVALL